MNQKIAVRLVEYRQTAGLSQEKLAEQLNVSRQAVSKWERGESLPDIGNIIALADLYGVTVDELLRGEAAGEETTEADRGADAAGANEEGPRNANATAIDDALEAQNPSNGNETSVQEASMVSDVAPGSANTTSVKSASRIAIIVIAAVIGVLLLGVFVFVLAFMPDGFAVRTEGESYEVSATYPMKDLVDDEFFAEGTGSFTASGIVSAIRLNWQEGNVVIKKVPTGETNSALVIKEKVPGNSTELHWQQEGGLLILEQAGKAEVDNTTSDSRDASTAPEVEILVPDAMAIMDLLQLNVSGGSVGVQGLNLMNLNLRQSQGSVNFSDSSVMSGQVELAQGLLNMEGNFTQTMDLIQHNGSSTIICQGEGPSTMAVEVNGGLSSIGIGNEEGCQLNYERTGGELTVHFPGMDAFPDLSGSTGSCGIGEERTLINAKITGGVLAVGNRLNIKLQGQDT